MAGVNHDHQELDFHLPPESIAKHPIEPRDECRLLIVHRSDGALEHRRFLDIAEYLHAGDVLVLNQSRVVRARVFGKLETRTGEKTAEVFFLGLAPNKDGVWPCLVRPGKKVAISGTSIRFADGSRGTLFRNPDQGWRLALPLASAAEAHAWLERNGEMPLPPYLHRPAIAQDAEDYQTVYAQDPGSVAAPTAGLHFTNGLLETLRAKGIHIAPLYLHVGYGTFAPLTEEAIASGLLHSESYSVPVSTREIVEHAKKTGNRVIAVGTTSTRALESIPHFGLEGETRLFIRPGFEFQYVDGLVTNFHLPGSSLLSLVAAILGVSQTRSAYAAAIAEGYRFYSYGDAMLVI